MCRRALAALLAALLLWPMIVEGAVLEAMDRAVAERERRQRAQVTLLDFAERMFAARHPGPFVRAPHHDRICAALEAVVAGDVKRLVINVPPRSSKTELAVVAFIPWCMGRYPDAEFIHASYSHGLASSNAAKVRDVMMLGQYAEIFGPPQFAADSNAKDHFRTLAGGAVYACGSGGTITGFGAGKMRPGFGGAIVIDDPHKVEESESKVVREGVLDWFSRTMESRKNSPDTPIIVIMQRLHARDLAGWLLGGGNGERWDSVVIPALDENGASFWPRQLPVEEALRIKASDSYRFAGQYQQAPKILGGNIIKGEWFRTYDDVPQLRWRAIYADTAQKTKEHNDYSVFQCWGLGVDGCAYLVDMIRGKWEAPELRRRAIAFWAKHACQNGPLGALRALKIEDKASGTGLIQDIRAEAHAPVIAVQRDRDKLSRVMDVLGRIESGLVYIPRSAAFVSDFLSECECFTANDTHEHDDQVDTMADAIKDMLVKGQTMTIGAY